MQDRDGREKEAEAEDREQSVQLRAGDEAGGEDVQREREGRDERPGRGLRRVEAFVHRSYFFRSPFSSYS